MKKIVLSVLVLQVAVGLSFGEECTSPIRVSMTVLNTSPLAGEPIEIQIVSENTSKCAQEMRWAYVHLDRYEEPCIDRHTPLVSFIPGPVAGGGGEPSGVLEPHKTKRILEYEVSRNCNLNARDSETPGPHLICYEPRFPSQGCRTCVSFEIQTPEGIDREVFERFPPRLRDVETDRDMLDFSILEEYPTSTYAGYELAYVWSVLMYPFGKTVAEAVDRLSDPNFFSLRIPKYELERDHGYENATPNDYRRAAESRAEVLRTFLEAHPDFARRGILEGKLAHLELALGNPAEAYRAWDWISKHGNEKEAARATEFKAAMKAKRLVRD